MAAALHAPTAGTRRHQDTKAHSQFVFVSSCLRAFGLKPSARLSYQQIPQQRPGRGSVQGMITDERGRGLPAAEVVLKSGARDVARALTSGDGVFRFTDIAPGEYVLSVTREGYSPLNQGGLRVTASELVTVELKLLPTGPREEGKKIEPGPPMPYGNVIRPKPDPNAEPTPLPPGEKV